MNNPLTSREELAKEIRENILKDMHYTDGVDDCAGWDEEAMGKSDIELADFILEREAELRNKLESHKQAVGKALEFIKELAENDCDFPGKANCDCLWCRAKEALAELGKEEMMSEQTVKCPVCDNPYVIYQFYAGDQSACEDCRARARKP